jgi:hypothetical protein
LVLWSHKLLLNLCKTLDILKKPALSGSVSHLPGKNVTQCRYSISVAC